MADFIPGLELNRRFYHDTIRPLLDQYLPGLAHDAALIGSGSDILGFDTPRSTDHDWGPRAYLFLNEADFRDHANEIMERLRYDLPRQFHGFSTNFADVPDEPGNTVMDSAAEGPIQHRVVVTTVARYLKDYLDFDWQRGEDIAPEDWLTFSEQKLRTLTQGAVYHAGLGDVTAMRVALAYYPHDVWLYCLAAGWRRIEQEEPFVGRCGDAGDELGSRIITARLVRDLMHLCFTIERIYAPYPKWFGSAFGALSCSAELTPVFHDVLGATTWQEREHNLAQAYSIVAQMHNNLGITDPLPIEVTPFHDRPYLVIHGEHFKDAIAATITDARVRRLVKRRNIIGSIDQFSDSTDIRSYSVLRQRLKTLYD